MAHFGDMSRMLKQAQKLQAEMAKLKDSLAEKTVEASAGGGMVTVIVTGAQELKAVSINPEVVEAEDVEMLQDLIVAAVNEGLRKAQEMVTEEMGKLTGGLGLKLPDFF